MQTQTTPLTRRGRRGPSRPQVRAPALPTARLPRPAPSSAALHAAASPFADESTSQCRRVAACSCSAPDCPRADARVARPAPGQAAGASAQSDHGSESSDGGRGGDGSPRGRDDAGGDGRERAPWESDSGSEEGSGGGSQQAILVNLLVNAVKQCLLHTNLGRGGGWSRRPAHMSSRLERTQLLGDSGSEEGERLPSRARCNGPLKGITRTTSKNSIRGRRTEGPVRRRPDTVPSAGRPRIDVLGDDR